MTEEASLLPKTFTEATDKPLLERSEAYQYLDSVVQHTIMTKATHVSDVSKYLGLSTVRSALNTVGSASSIAQSNAWLEAEKEYMSGVNTQIQHLLANEGTGRVANFSATLPLGETTRSGENMIYVDASKSNVSRAMKGKLLGVLEKVKFEAARTAMFSGDAINTTENRSVLHVALRAMDVDVVIKDNQGNDVMPAVRAVREQLRVFSEKVRSGEWKGHTGKPVKHVVNIGIGGSDLGPVMATEALKPYGKAGLHMHYVSNIDGTQLADTLAVIDIEQTLFIVASKTFTTAETLTNATTARAHLLEHYKGDESSVAKHFVAVSTNTDKVKEFGIDTNNMFAFWDWVGGRYSMWSAIGLSVAIYIGWENYAEMLTGASLMDEHFRTAPANCNIPVLLAITGIYYNNFAGCQTHAILPYSQHLHRLPAYLQQLDMESNGKFVSTSANRTGVDVQTGPIIFGEPGTNGQHAFYQLLHQGTKVVPCDFIGTLETHSPVSGLLHHKMLMANMFAQAEALMNGKPIHVAAAELRDTRGLNPASQEKLVAHKTFPGNRPSNTIILRHLTPRSFGALVAAYEHKVFTQGVVWGINSFDQWGVELGKTLATNLLGQMLPNLAGAGHDASTNSLLTMFNNSLPPL